MRLILDMAVLKTYFIYRTTFYYIIKIQDFHKMNLLWVFYTKYLQKGLKIDNSTLQRLVR